MKTEDDDATEIDAGRRVTTLGAYEIVRPIGKGGMGVVWEGRHQTLGRRVAVKVLHPEFARNPEHLARFIREARAAARIAHPNVATVYDVGQDRERAYLVMEFLEGEDLGALLDREKTLAASRVVDLLLPVVAAMEAAHADGVVHRDLKPGNVFLARGRDGAVTPKVVDFGFSKVVEADPGADADLTRRDTALGTLFYMPLEQIRSSRTAGPACDQYALGVTIYRCVTGKLPFDGRAPPEIFSAIVKGAFSPMAALVTGLPPGLEAVVTRAMHPTPQGRFPSMKAFGAALIPYASQTVRGRWADTFGVGALAAATEGLDRALADTVRVPPPSLAASRWRSLAVIAALLLAVAVLALALWRR